MTLNQSVVKSARYAPSGAAHQIIWDNKLPGFGLRLYPSGRRSYMIAYRHEGRKRRMVIDDATRISLDTARKLARKRFSEIADNRDPLEEKRHVDGNAFGQFAKKYIKHQRQRIKTWEDQKRLVDRFLKPWAQKELLSITRSDVANLHHKIGTDQANRKGTPYLANRVLALVSRMFEVAIDLAGYPEKSPNPARRIKPFPEKSRERRIEPEEMPALAAAIDNEPNQVAANAFRLILLTGMRRTEALESKWSYVDRRRKVLVLPDTKSGQQHKVPLSEAAIKLLNGIKRKRGNPYIFPSDKSNGPLVNPDKAWRRIRDEAGVSDVRIHDLRRSVGSLMADEGVSLHIIGKVLNHKNPSTTKIYARLGDKAPAEALDKHGQRMLKVIEGGKK